MIKLNHLNYYRLPWNLTDNSISWLEPTSKCNLYCEGCYRNNEKDGHKSFEEIKKDLDVFTSLRKSDGISIAGGDPLTHPDILDIVADIKRRNLKPIINTNGLALTKDLLKKLKKSGVFGFTFHIDSKQNRPGWKNKNEVELNELRYHYARMLADEGNISCAFNSTVYDDTRQYIPAMLEWAHKNIDIVQVMVFILYRAVNNKDFDYYVGPKKIDMNQLVYSEGLESRAELKAPEIVELIRTKYPDFDPCAYLNGSEKPDSFKWLLTGRLGTKQKIYGYLGAKSMEAIQMFNHLLYNRYLAYASPKDTRRGRSILLLSAIDKKLRKAFKNYYKNPFNLFRKLYYQSVMIIQPVDFLQDGRQNMCDGCPDITVWNGQLVWSCRMEEQLNFGMNVKAYPKGFMN
ncbi:radical SAM protein [Ignavibacterium sp.]|uniref:radical SAM protein n=1 Tax=Ignavibacterium sp. TaxID=2651167 RepID=UPI00307F19F8